MVRLFAQQYQTENFKQWKITLKLWLQQGFMIEIRVTLDNDNELGQQHWAINYRI